jgi:hypothetical protein
VGGAAVHRNRQNKYGGGTGFFLEISLICLRFISTLFWIFGAIFSYFLDRQS